MANRIEVGKIGGTAKERRQNPVRVIEFGPLRHMIEKYQGRDVPYVLYKLSYAGKYLYVKSKSLVGSLVMMIDGLSTINPEGDRFKEYFYRHLYNHLQVCDGRFRIHIVFNAKDESEFYQLLKEEQMALDAARYDKLCLNNQIDAYVPKYSEKTGMYGWIPKQSILNFQRWLQSQERQDLLRQYKK